MNTLIDHTVRKRLGLTVHEYVVMDCYILYRGSGNDITKFQDFCSHETGIPRAAVKKAMNALTTAGYIGNRDGITSWFKAVLGSTDVSEVPRRYKTLADEAIAYMNRATSSSFSPSTYYDLFSRIDREIPGVEPAHFRMVVDHRVSLWANDEAMVKYLRPATIFGSRFKRYLDEAYSAIKK